MAKTLSSPPCPLPILSEAGLAATCPVVAIDEQGKPRKGRIAAERALTVYLDKQEIITLMTLGTRPELLILGWLRNQRMVQDVHDIKAVQVDWETESVAVTTWHGVSGLKEKLDHRTVTSGCGQGTMFGDLMAGLQHLSLPRVQLRQSGIYALLKTLTAHNEIYRQAGAVHGCALCQGENVELFVEDVGRHNAVDAIAGHMWLKEIAGAEKIFYTTGRLTSEMVIKVALMGIPVLLSRSGLTHMGLELAQQTGVILIARAKGKHFMVYHGADQMTFDTPPS